MIDNDKKKKGSPQPADDIDREMRSLGLLRDEKPKTKSVDGDDSVARVIDDEFSKLGYSPAARLSILGDVGRENSWNRETIFGGHVDPASYTNGRGRIDNRGIISWNGDRLTKLNEHLKKEGVYGRGDDDELRGMARFMDRELQDEYADDHKTIKSAASTRDASKALRRYIRYSMKPQYNSPDPDFEAVNNRKWAERAKGLGLAAGDVQKSSFDFDTFAAGLMGDKKPAKKGIPSSEPVAPTFPGDGPGILPPGQPFYADDEEKRTGISPAERKNVLTNRTPEDLDAERIKNGVIPTPDADGYKYPFEVDGKIGEGLTYTGSFNKRYFGKDADGNDYEFDKLAGHFKPTKPLPFSLKTSKGEKLTEAGPAAADGSRILVDSKGKRYEAIPTETAADENGNKSVSWAVRPEGSPQAPPTGKQPAGLKSRTVRPQSGEGTLLDEAKTYDFEQTGRMKLKDGTELGLVTDAEAPEGKARFRDKDGETYLFDRESGKLEDESLAEVGAHIPVLRSPITDSLDVAKKTRARQIAGTVAAQYGIDAEDANAWLMQRGFVDPETGEELEPRRYYKDRSQIAEYPGTETPDDFHRLTRRDLRDLVVFGKEQKQKRENVLLSMIEQGEQPSPELMRNLRVDPKAFQSDRYEDLQMAATKGQVSKAQLDQVIPRFRQQGQDEYQARISAKRALGFVSREEADAELQSYERILADKRTRTASITLGPQQQHNQFVNIQQIREDQARMLAQDTARRYGSALNYERQKDLEAKAEEDRLKRIAEMPFIQRWNERVGFGEGPLPGTFAWNPAKRVARGAINTLLAETLKGGVVWSKGLVDLVEDLTGIAPEINRAEDHPLYRAGISVEKWVNWALKTNKDIDAELLAGKLPHTVGTSLAMMFPALAAKNPRAAIGLYSTLQMGGGSYSEARAAGASPEDALNYALVNSGLFGWTETLGISKALLRLKGLGGGAYSQFFRELAKNAPNEVAEEILLNEGPQTIGANYIAKSIYDPDRNVFEGLTESLLLAGLSGGMVSTLVTAANTVQNQAQIRAQIESDRIHGLPAFRNFGEAGVYIHGKPAEVTPEMEPLVVRHKAVTDEIKFAREAIRRIKVKAAETESVTEKAAFARTITDLQGEMASMYGQQTETAEEIIKLSGVPKPKPIELREQWEDGADLAGNVNETPESTHISPDMGKDSENLPTSDGFDATLTDGRRVKILEDRGDILKVEDERGRATLQPVRKFEDLDAFRSKVNQDPGKATLTPESKPQDAAEFVHERDVTLEAQLAATMDPKAEGAIATLFTDPASAPQNTPGTVTYTLPDGTLIINVEKFRSKYGVAPAARRLAIESGQIPHEELIGGKAVPDRDTTKGTAVVTVDADGNELNSSKISDKPVEEWTAEDHANAAKQADLDKQRFGDAATSSGIADTEEIISSRQEDRPIETKDFEIVDRRKPQATGLAALAQAKKERVEEAYSDPMTGLGGGKAKSFAKERDKTRKQPYWWVALDFNGTKGLNDNFGHSFVDDLFKEVAEAMRRAAAELGISDRGLFHQSGDEFAATGDGGVEDGQKFAELVEKYYGVRVHEKDGKKFLSSVSGNAAPHDAPRQIREDGEEESVYDVADRNLTPRKTKHKIAQAKEHGTEHPKDREGKPLVDPDAPAEPTRRSRAVIEPPKTVTAVTQSKPEKTGLEKYEDRKLQRQGFSLDDIEALSPEDRKKILAEKTTKRDFYRKGEKIIRPLSVKPFFVEISRSVRSRLRKKNAVRRLHKLGYAFTVEISRVKITGIPPGMTDGEVAGTFETTVYNVDEERRAQIGEGNIKNLQSMKRASLGQFVRASGGLKPGTFQSQARGRRKEGELERFRGFAGIINEKSGRTVEDMAQSAQEAGYFGLDEDSGVGGGQLNPDTFLEALEADLAGQTKYYPVYGGTLADEGFQVLEDEVAKLEREQVVESILSGLTEEEYALTKSIAALLNDADVWELIEQATFTAEISAEASEQIVKIGVKYGLPENETETALSTLIASFRRWNGQEEGIGEPGSEIGDEGYLISGFGGQGDPFEKEDFYHLEEPDDYREITEDDILAAKELFPNEDALSIEELEARAIAEESSGRTVEDEALTSSPENVRENVRGGTEVGAILLDSQKYRDAYLEDPTAFGQRARIGDAPDIDESVYSTAVDAAAHEAATSPHNDRPDPTQAQKEAGNYKKGHIRINGIDITIENPAGSERSGVDSDGKKWSVTMQQHYGYIRRTTGADEEHIDVFIKDGIPADFAGDVYIVDQVDPESGEFDEHKVMLGFSSEEDARAAYLSNYTKDWKGLGEISTMALEGFKSWISEKQETPRSEQIEELITVPAAEQSGFGFMNAGGLFQEGDPAPIEAAASSENEDDRKKRLAEFAAKNAEQIAKETIAAYGEATGSYLNTLSSSKDAIAPIADTLIKLRNLVLDKGDAAKQLVEDAADALDLFVTSREQKAPVDDVLKQPRLDGKTFSDIAQDLARSMESGEFGDNFRDYLNAITGPAEEAAENNRAIAAAITAPINDFGEKIGGARKDTSESGYVMIGGKKSEQPAWMKGFQIGETPEGKFRPFKATDRGFIQWQSRDEYATKEEALTAIKLASVVQKFRTRKGNNGYEIYRRVTDRKFHTIKDGFETEKDAMRYLVEHVDEYLDYKPQFPERPHIEDLQRTGKDFREGKNVTTEEFVTQFGFTGGEFGNWVPQDERQRILNMAYDGLMDLADILELPPRALSLNGQLSIAFGSRGHGLTGAAAHYEVKRAVFNLTRLNGAGAMAHEWFHALDHYFGAQDRGLTLEKDDSGIVKAVSKSGHHFLSHGHLSKSGVRQELLDAFKDLIKTIYKQPKIVEVSIDRYEGIVRKNTEERDRMIAELRRYLESEYKYARKSKPATAEQMAEFDKLVDMIIGGNWGRDDAQVPTKSRHAFGMKTFEVFKDLNDLIVAVRGRSEFKPLSERSDGGRVRKIASYSKSIRDGELQLENYRQDNREERVTPTKFAYDAKDIDRMRTSDYWSSEHEMAARAFEAFIEDQLKESGDVSQYLVHSTENSVYKILYGLNPYPEGVERERINEAFWKFFDAVETEETDQGVMLFALSGPFSELEEAIRNFAEDAVRNPKHEKSVISLGTVSDANVDAVKQATGLDIAGYERVIDNYSVKHIINEHGSDATELPRGQVAVTPDDFLLIPEIVENPDSIEAGGATRVGRETIRYMKRFNGEIYFVEEARTGKKQLVPDTLYKRKAPVPPKLSTPEATLLSEQQRVSAETDADTDDNTDPLFSIVGWHGSPHRFDKFSTQKIGTGEGAQAYGHGLYFTDRESVADHYKRKLGGREVRLHLSDGRSYASVPNEANSAAELEAIWEVLREGSFPAAIAKIESYLANPLQTNPANRKIWGESIAIIRRWEAGDGVVTRGRGAKYKVELKPEEDEYLLWDKPLAEQSDKVRAALEKVLDDDAIDGMALSSFELNTAASFDDPETTGGQMYRDLSRYYGNQEEVSESLHMAGVRGVKYLDGASRNRPEKNRIRIGEIEVQLRKRDEFLQRPNLAERIRSLIGKEIEDLRKELAEIESWKPDYNYVIFDDADVEVLDILFKKRSKEAADLLKNVLPKAHTQEIFEGIESRFEGEDLYLNEHASEQIRRLLGTQEFNFSGKERDYASFDGVTIGTGQLRALATLGRTLRDEYVAAGYTDDHLARFDQLLDNLDELAKQVGDFGVMFTFDDALPEEHFHQEDLRAGRTDRAAIEELKNSQFWKNPGKTFTDLYGTLSDHDMATELAAKLATDQAGKFGWSSLPDFEQAKRDFLSTWAQGILRKNKDIIEQKGLDWFTSKFRRIAFHASLTTEQGTAGETDPGSVRPGSAKRQSRQRSRGDSAAGRRKVGPSAEGNQQQTARQKSRPDRSAEEQNYVEIDELDAAALGVTVGEVRVKNRQFARSLRESGRDATDVPYVPESEIGWIEEAKKVLDESIKLADASDFVKHDYSHALDVFENPETTGSTRVVLGIALIDHLGAMGDYAMMLRVGEMTTKIVGTAAQALRACQLVSKYDFARGVELARKALEKRGKELSPKEINRIRELSKLYNASVREKAMIEQTLRDAEEILKEQQQTIAELQDALQEADGQKGVSNEIADEMRTAIKERDKAIGEQLEEIEEKDDLISNLKRQLDRWKKKRESEKRAAVRRSTTHKDLLERKEAIRAALAERFPGRPVFSLVERPDRPLMSVVANSADFDDQTRALLVDYIALKIFDGDSYEATIDAIADITDGILTEAEVLAIHADAVDVTAGEKVERDPAAIEKLKVRNEHKRKAKAFREGPKDPKKGSRTKVDKLSRLEMTMLELAKDDDKLGAAAVFLNNARHLEDFTRSMELAYPELTKTELDDLFVHARELRDKARKKVAKDLYNAKSDIKLTQEIFDEFTRKRRFADRDVRDAGGNVDRHYKQLQKSAPVRYTENVLQVLNIPKTLMSGGEVSYIGRQGFLPLVLFTRLGLKGLKGVAAGFRSDEGRLIYEEGLRSYEHFQRAQAAGVVFSQIGDHNLQDEHFNAGKIFEKAAKSGIFGVRHIGKAQQAFEHAYTLPGDAQRLFIAGALFDLIDEQSLPPHKREAAEKAAAKIANAFTGKSNLAIFKRDNLLTKFLNTIGFAPSYVGSRFEAAFYLSPVGILAAPRGLRMLLAKKQLRFHSTMFALAALAALALDPEGDDDERSRWDIIDPSSKSFLKGRIRGTDLKFDLTANLSEPMRLMVYNAVGSAYFAATGQWNKLGDIWKQERERYIYTDAGEPLRYFRGKLSPFGSLVADLAYRKDYLGRDVKSAGDIAVAVTERLYPLTYKQALESLVTDQATEIMKPGLAETKRQQLSNLMKGDLNYENAIAVFVTSALGANFQDYAEAEKSRAELKAWDIWDGFSSKKKSPEEKAIDAGLRRIFRFRQEQIRRGSDTKVLDRRIEELITKHAITPQARQRLEDQATGSRFAFVTKGMSADNIRMLLDEYATTREKPELQKILDAELAGQKAKTDKPRKDLQQKLHSSDVAEAIKLFRERESTFTAQQKLEAKNKLRSKAMNSNSRRQLSREDYDAVKKILPTFPPHRSERKTKKPIRGLDSLKGVY